jgi:hypothetical protein
MNRIITASVALLALTGAATAQVVIQQAPIVVTPPPVVIQQAPIVVAPPPVVYAPPPPAPVCIVLGQPWDWLNLRTFPNGPIITAMPPGTPLTWLNTSGQWGFFQTPLGFTGYAFLPYTTCRFS